MQYHVHRLDIRMESDQEKLEAYLNSLPGEIISIIPNVSPIFKFMGATAKVDFLYIVTRNA